MANPTIATLNAATKREITAIASGLTDSAGDLILGENWPVQVITSSGKIVRLEWSGPTGTWTQTPHYTSGLMDYIEIVDPTGTGTWRQAISYNAGLLTSVGPYIKL